MVPRWEELRLLQSHLSEFKARVSHVIIGLMGFHSDRGYLMIPALICHMGTLPATIRNSPAFRGALIGLEIATWHLVPTMLSKTGEYQ